MPDTTSNDPIASISPDADTEANALFTSLMAGPGAVTIGSVNGYTVPLQTGELFATLNPLTNADLTTQVVGGTGTFDVLMGGVKAQLDGEYKAGRITGAEYTKAYIALVQAAIGGAVQYLLGRDQAYWQSVTAQLAAQTAQVAYVQAKVGLETAKAQLLQMESQAYATQAEYALTKLKLATEQAAYRTAEYTFEHILPIQKDLVAEQREAQRAQTIDTRSDGTTPVSGSVGMQKQLYAQQITSYKRDAEVKAAKLFTDAWVTQKTLDEGLVPPMGFTNDSINEVLAVLMTNNSFGNPVA